MCWHQGKNSISPLLFHYCLNKFCYLEKNEQIHLNNVWEITSIIIQKVDIQKASTASSRYSFLFYSLLIQMNEGFSVIPISNSDQTLEERDLQRWSKFSHHRLLQCTKANNTRKTISWGVSWYNPDSKKLGTLWKTWIKQNVIIT